MLWLGYADLSWLMLSTNIYIELFLLSPWFYGLRLLYEKQPLEVLQYFINEAVHG